MISKLLTISYYVYKNSTQVSNQTHIESFRSGSNDARSAYIYSFDKPSNNSSLIDKIEIELSKFVDIIVLVDL